MVWYKVVYIVVYKHIKMSIFTMDIGQMPFLEMGMHFLRTEPFFSFSLHQRLPT